MAIWGLSTAWRSLHPDRLGTVPFSLPYGVRSAVTSRASRIMVLVPAMRRQEASKFGQACCEQLGPTGAGCPAGRPWRGQRHAGFDLRGKAGKNGRARRQ